MNLEEVIEACDASRTKLKSKKDLKKV